jgi:hypothetical protein
MSSDQQRCKVLLKFNTLLLFLEPHYSVQKAKVHFGPKIFPSRVESSKVSFFLFVFVKTWLHFISMIKFTSMNFVAFT